MKVHRIDHVGIIVNDLPAAKAFFLDLGLELQGEASLEGAWLDELVGHLARLWPLFIVGAVSVIR